MSKYWYIFIFIVFIAGVMYWGLTDKKYIAGNIPAYDLNFEHKIYFKEVTISEELYFRNNLASPFALISAIPKELAKNNSEININTKNNFHILEPDPIFEITPITAQQDLDIELKYPNATKKISSFNILLPEDFLKKLSEKQILTFIDRMKKFTTLNNDFESHLNLEKTIAANLTTLFNENDYSSLSQYSTKNNVILFEDVFEEVSSEFFNRFIDIFDNEYAKQTKSQTIKTFDVIVDVNSESIGIITNDDTKNQNQNDRNALLSKYPWPNYIEITLTQKNPVAIIEKFIVNQNIKTNNAINNDSIPPSDVKIDGISTNEYIDRNMIIEILDKEQDLSEFGQEPYTLKITFNYSDFFNNALDSQLPLRLEKELKLDYGFFGNGLSPAIKLIINLNK